MHKSVASGMLPAVFKSAYITPWLKKASLDPADTKSYRPISNLPVLSKTLERLVAHQLVEHLNLWRLLPDLQSAYRAHHSTETAGLRVLSDILDALDRGDFAVLTLLDLSAAFDTVDHTILLRRLQITYGITDTVQVWFASYLHERKLSVRYRGSCSTTSSLLCGVPQGSVLRPILFLLYTADLLGLIEGMDVHPHFYADDTQIYGLCAHDEASALLQRISTCVAQTSEWMKVNRLQLNAAKSEQLWCTSPRQQDRLPNRGWL